MSIQPAQCRAARGLLNLSQSDAAALAYITGPTISGFERNDRVPSHNNLKAIQEALEAAGAIFIPANGGGPGVRLQLGVEEDRHGDPAFSPTLCRAGRYMANLSQEGLAIAAGVGRSTIAEFESGARMPTPENRSAIRSALESAGVAFIAANDVAGPGVRLQR